MRLRFLLALVSLVPLLCPAADEAPAKPAVQSRAVTLDGPMTLKVVLEQLEKQSGNRLPDLRPKLGQRVTNPDLALELRKVPYWQAVDAVAKAADVNVAYAPQAGAVGILKGPHKSLPVSYSGPFRLAVKEVKPRAEAGFVDVLTELTWEPRFLPMLVKTNRDSVSVIDAKGKAETVTQGGAGNIRLAGLPAREFSLQRLPVPAGVAFLGPIEVAFRVLTPPRTLTFTFEKPAAEDHKTVAGVAATIDGIKRERGVWVLDVSLRYKDLDLESHEGWAFDHPDYLPSLEKDGKRLVAKGHEIAVQERGPIRLRYPFVPPDPNAQPADYTLRLSVPAEPVFVPVKFRFEKLPLGE